MTDTTGQVSDETLAQLRRLAAEATPGPWATTVYCSGMSVDPMVTSIIADADAAYIATMDPPTTLALLDALDAARAEVERLRIGLDGAHGNADRMRKSLLDERDAIAEKIAVAIETEGSDAHWAATFLNGLNHAARIAREVGGQHV